MLSFISCSLVPEREDGKVQWIKNSFSVKMSVDYWQLTAVLWKWTSELISVFSSLICSFVCAHFYNHSSCYRSCSGLGCSPPPPTSSPVHSPLLGLQNFSMPCLIRTMRDSSVKDSMTLKLHSGLTSKNVMPFFSAYALACSVGTCRLKARCSRLPTRIRGTPGACWVGNHKTHHGS